MLPNIEAHEKLFYGVGNLSGVLVPAIPNYSGVIIAPSSDRRSCFIIPTGGVGGTEYSGRGSCPESEVAHFIQWYLKDRYLLASMFNKAEEPFFSFLFEMFKTSPVNWRWSEVEKLQSHFPSV